MGSAVERLAAELLKLSDDEWARLDERRIASEVRDGEIPESSNDGGQGLLRDSPGRGSPIKR